MFYTKTWTKKDTSVKVSEENDSKTINRQKMEIQINRKIRTFQNTTKLELKSQAQKENILSNWTTVDAGVDDVKKYIGEGYAVRSGIKEGGNDKEAVKRCNWLFLDFDNSSVESTLKNSWTKQACLWYYTPSYVEGENEKHRLVFQLRRTVDGGEYETIYKFLQKFYTNTDNTPSPGWLFFGARGTDKVTVLDDKATLDVDTILEACEYNPDTPASTIKQLNQNVEKSTNAPKIVKNAESGIRSQVLKYLAEEVWHKACNGSDINALYCLHEHDLTYQGSDRQNIAKWHGCRPEGWKGGTGFYVFWQDRELPPVWNNQGECELDKGTIIEYWHHYKKLLHGATWGDIEWEKDKRYKNFRSVVDDICSHFNVESFDFNAAFSKNKEVRIINKLELLNEVLTKYVLSAKTGAKPLFIYYNKVDKVWEYNTEITEVWRYCVKPFMAEIVDNPIDLEMPKTANEYMSLIKLSSIIPTTTRLKFDAKIKTEFIPMANGEFNIYTKEMIDFNHEIYNLNRYEHEYTGEVDAGVIERFNKWMEWTYKDESVRKTVINWLALNIYGMAVKTKIIMAFWGCPGTGKSTIYNLIKDMLQDNATIVSGQKLNMQDNKFALQNVAGKFAMLIDEANIINNVGWNNLKQLTGSDKPNVGVEEKHIKGYDIIFRAGITATYQDEFKMPASDDGGIRRRVIPIHHTDDLINEEWSDIGDYLRENVKSIFNWLIKTIDPNEALKQVSSYGKSSELNKQVTEILTEQDDVMSFMSDQIEFTNNPEDYVTNMELQASFKTYLQQERLLEIDKYEQGKVTKISNYIRTKARNKKNGFNWNYADDSPRMSIDGVRVRVLIGMKLKNAQTDF